VEDISAENRIDLEDEEEELVVQCLEVYIICINSCLLASYLQVNSAHI